MNTLKELTDSWRDDHAQYCVEAEIVNHPDDSPNYFADQLEQWMAGLWTEITEDNYIESPVMLYGDSGSIESTRTARIIGREFLQRGYTHHRPLIPGIDTPEVKEASDD